VATDESRREGRRLADRYLLEAEVASGGMGTVWRARDETLGRIIAVKILHDGLARDPDVLERFRLEAVAAARLSHPSVVRVFDTGIDEGTCYIVMELFDGRPLDDILASRGPLAPGEAARILGELLQALAHAHRQGVVHRDVKPANIMLDERAGLLKVTDFGIAKAAFAQSDLTTTGNLLGTASYLAPEQVSGGDIDPRTDLYAAGIVLYEALTGRKPFQGETHIATAMMRLTKDPLPPGALRTGIPRNLEAVVMKALAREPEARFQSAEEMAAALDRSAPSRGSTRAPVPIHESRPEERSPGLFRSWVLVPLALIALAGLAVGGFLIVERLLEGGGGEPSAADEGENLRQIRVASASDWDPLGDDQESPESVADAFDGDPASFWQTEGYNTADFGGLGKTGLGLIFDLGTDAQIGRVRLQSTNPGWPFELYASTEPFSGEGPSGEPLPSLDGATSFTAGEEMRIDLEPVTARYVLVWITQLVPTEDGNRASMAEVEFLGPRE
jgi:eukaryotic-like serine/threonine-protein kinase